MKPYILLRDALEKADRVAVVKVALRQRERLAMLRVGDGVLVMQTLLWPDEVREPSSGLDDDVEVRDQELAMAEPHQRAVRRVRPEESPTVPRGARGGHRREGRRRRGRRPGRGAGVHRQGRRPDGGAAPQRR